MLLPTAESSGSNAAVQARWISAIAPTEEEKRTLTDKHGVSVDFVQHALDPDERPRTETEENATLVVLRIPVPTPEGAKVPFETIPLGLVVAQHTIVTICSQDNAVLEGLRRYTNTEELVEHRQRIVLHAMALTAELYLKHLRTIETATDAIEERLKESLQNGEVLELLRYQKSLVYFTTALRSTALLLERLQHQPTFHLPESDRELLEDALIELRQAIEMSSVATEILSGTMDAFASIISNNLNVVMKALTALTIVLLFPSMIASFYGMNVELPGQHSPHAFLVAVVGSLFLSSSVAVFFRRRSWL